MYLNNTGLLLACHTKQMSVARIECSASGKETKRAEERDQAHSSLAAAVRDAHKRMIVVQTRSCAASLTQGRHKYAYASL